MARRSTLAPSLLSADLASMGRVASGLVAEGVDWIHLDMMDGHFVHNWTFGPPVVKSLRVHLPHVFLDAHLMVKEPLRWLVPLQEAKVNHVTIHAESEGAIDACFKAKEMGFSVGMALKPETPLDALIPCWDVLNLCLLMTVEPGLGGQKFMESVLEKIDLLNAHASRPFKLQVDGGIQISHIQGLKASVDVFVIGSWLFPHGTMDPKRVQEALRACEAI